MSERGHLEVRATGNSTGFTTMLNQMNGAAKKFTSDLSRGWSVGGIAGGILGGFASSLGFQAVRETIKHTLEEGKRLKDVAEQFDLTTDSVQAYERAMAKAGMESTRFFTFLDRVQAWREEIQRDPSKGGLADMLGLTGMVNDPNVTKEQLGMALLNSGASRAQINSIGGRGAARLKAALPYVNTNNILSEDEVDALDEGAVNSGTIPRFLGFIAKKSMAMWARVFTKKGWQELGAYSVGGIQGLQAFDEQQEAAKEAEQDKERTANEVQQSYDQMVRENKKEVANQRKLRDSEEQLRDAKRKGMSPTQKKKDLQDEIADLTARAQYYEESADLNGPSENAKLAGILTRKARLEAQLKGPRHRSSALEMDEYSQIGLLSTGAAGYSGWANNTEEIPVKMDDETSNNIKAIADSVQQIANQNQTDPYE